MFENIEHIVQGATFMQLGFMYTYPKGKNVQEHNHGIS